MSSSLAHVKIVIRPADTRKATNHSWLDTKQTFSLDEWADPRHSQFGALRVLNEDRVMPGNGFPTHFHQNVEIFSYILSGQLIHRHRAFMQKEAGESHDEENCYQLGRGDVQLVSGGSGIYHSEYNGHDQEWAHFLQIWILPWRSGLQPKYHVYHFPDEAKRQGFVTIITPLKAGSDATLAEEEAAAPNKEKTLPIHADVVFSAGIVPPSGQFVYHVGGGDCVTSRSNRNVYIHVPETTDGKARIKLNGRDDAVLKDGDGAYVVCANANDELKVENVGTFEAEVVVIDSDWVEVIPEEV